jgi:hypothetical protein
VAESDECHLLAISHRGMELRADARLDRCQADQPATREGETVAPHDTANLGLLRDRAAIEEQARTRAEEEDVCRGNGLPVPQWPPDGPLRPASLRLTELANR